MAEIIGHSGSVTAGGTAVGTAKIWNLSLQSDTVDVTKFSSSGWKENAVTLKGWSGSITTVFDGGADTGEAALITSLTAGSEVALVMLTGATGAGDSETFTGSAYVTSLPITQDVNGVVEVTFDFVGTGALTIAGVV